MPTTSGRKRSMRRSILSGVTRASSRSRISTSGGSGPRASGGVSGVRLIATPPKFTGPVNLGNPAEFSMVELAEAVRQLTGSRSPLVMKPLPQDDPRQRCPDVTLAREALGWQATTALEDGLKPTIAYFDKLLSQR